MAGVLVQPQGERSLIIESILEGELVLALGLFCINALFYWVFLTIFQSRSEEEDAIVQAFRNRKMKDLRIIKVEQKVNEQEKLDTITRLLKNSRQQRRVPLPGTPAAPVRIGMSILCPARTEPPPLTKVDELPKPGFSNNDRRLFRLIMPSEFVYAALGHDDDTGQSSAFVSEFSEVKRPLIHRLETVLTKFNALFQETPETALPEMKGFRKLQLLGRQSDPSLFPRPMDWARVAEYQEKIKVKEQNDQGAFLSALTFENLLIHHDQITDELLRGGGARRLLDSAASFWHDMDPLVRIQIRDSGDVHNHCRQAEMLYSLALHVQEWCCDVLMHEEIFDMETNEERDDTILEVVDQSLEEDLKRKRDREQRNRDRCDRRLKSRLNPDRGKTSPDSL